MPETPIVFCSSFLLLLLLHFCCSEPGCTGMGEGRLEVVWGGRVVSFFPSSFFLSLGLTDREGGNERGGREGNFESN